MRRAALSTAPAPGNSHAGPYDGLRQRKKAQQRSQMLDAALLLLRERGYEQTRLEDVARVADVSLKTIYNYFPSKQAILIELLRADRQRLVDAYEAVVAEPPDDLAEALARLMHADIGDVITAQDKALWRELLAAETRSHASPDDGFEQNRNVFKDFVQRLLKQFAARERLAGPVDLRVAADMVYALLMYDFRIYCSSEAMTPDDFLVLTRRQTRLLVAGWAVPDGAAP